MAAPLDIDLRRVTITLRVHERHPKIGCIQQAGAPIELATMPRRTPSVRNPKCLLATTTGAACPSAGSGAVSLLSLVHENVRTL